MKNNNIFSLNEDCFLVKGAKRGAIYKLKTGDVYSIDEESVELIERCESREPLEHIFALKNHDFQHKAKSYIENLVKEGIGRFLKKDESVSKIKIEEPSPLEFIWLEITARCNQRCVHCYLGNNPVVFEKNRMKQKDWTNVIKQAYELGCRRLQFIGGEPFLDYKNLFKLILISKKIGHEFIEVFTNATLLNDDKINFLASNQINIAVSVYGMNPKIHDQVTRTSNSFLKTIENIKKMTAKNIKTRVAIVGLSLNDNCISKTISLLSSIGIKNIKVDPIRPIGHGCSKDLISVELFKKQRRLKPEFPKCTLEKFQRAIYGHNCFSKNLCIKSDGGVIPCVMEREVVLGNVFNSSIQEILSSKRNEEIRNLNKDSVETCKDCEYRYCCFDCRPKARKESDGNIYAKPSNCFYDPYLGVWKNS
ncbi:MAG: radical SAM protein [Candidatus Portnoybacteria bacterium]|nr:radical SAM protein [Candidatus Portnoybacteria bacterium]